jgi:hypothetical protein
MLYCIQNTLVHSRHRGIALLISFEVTHGALQGFFFVNVVLVNSLSTVARAQAIENHVLKFRD